MYVAQSTLQPSIQKHRKGYFDVHSKRRLKYTTYKCQFCDKLCYIERELNAGRCKNCLLKGFNHPFLNLSHNLHTFTSFVLKQSTDQAWNVISIHLYTLYKDLTLAYPNPFSCLPCTTKTKKSLIFKWVRLFISF